MVGAEKRERQRGSSIPKAMPRKESPLNESQLAKMMRVTQSTSHFGRVRLFE